MNTATVNLNNAFSLIEENTDRMHISGEKTDSLIARAEKALEVSFNPSYRKFLKRYGMCSISCWEIYGLTKDEDFEHAKVPNAIWVTLDYYRNFNLPKGIVLIADTGDGDFYGIDTRQKDEYGESPVVLWMPGVSEPSDKLKIIAPDFGTFLYETIKNALENI